MISAQHAKRIVQDTFALSSLFIRRVLLTKPVTFDAYRAKTRELLMSQSRLAAAAGSSTQFTGRSNIAAIKLLEWDKEWDLMRYYGLKEYGRRWWSSRTSPTSKSSRAITSNNSDGASTKKAQIAFMITSEQRRTLGELGYGSDEIRSFKPIEALLLVRNSVPKLSDAPEYDFREKLKVLVDENDKLMRAEQQNNLEKTVIEHKSAADEALKRVGHPRDMSPEEVANAHVKPDVALALLDADKSEEENIYQSASNSEIINEGTKYEQLKRDATSITSSPLQSEAATQVPSTNSEPVVTPSDSEELHMKPDVAAAFLSSHQPSKSQQAETGSDEDEGTNEPCWYEVIEVEDSTEKEQIIALFSNRKEAEECACIKESFRSRGGKEKSEVRSTFVVRRRWNT